MPRQTEPNANNALGILLQGMFSRSRVYYENTRVIVDHPGLQPDILITSPGRSPVVVEAEYMPAYTVEPEAKERLGLDVTVDSRPIEAAIALHYPSDMSEVAHLADALKSSTLSYCVFTQERKAVKRFPESGWLDGSVEDLADLIRLVSVPQWAVDAATEILRKGIDNAAKILDETATSRPETVKDIAARLGMTDVTQTRRMACAIMANAMVFHERIAKMHAGIKTLEKVCGEERGQPPARGVGFMGRYSQDQLLAHFRHRQGHCRRTPVGRCCANSDGVLGTQPRRLTPPAWKMPMTSRAGSFRTSLRTGSTWPPSTPFPPPQLCWQGWQ